MKRIKLIGCILLCALAIRAQDQPAKTNYFQVASLNLDPAKAVSPYAIKWNTATGQVWVLTIARTTPAGVQPVYGQTAVGAAPPPDTISPGRFTVTVVDSRPTAVLLDQLTGDAWLIDVAGRKLVPLSDIP